MSESSPPEPGARVSFVLATLLVFMGSCGAFHGMADLDGVTFDTAAAERVAPEQAAQAERWVEVQRTLYNEPNRRPLAAANIVVSAMLVLGGLLVLGRRKSALWWVKHAILANVLWIALKLGSWLYNTHVHASYLSELLTSSTRAGGDIQWMIASMVVASLINLGAHVFIGWRLSRRDIRSFLMGP